MFEAIIKIPKSEEFSMSNVYASKHPLVAHKLSRLRDKHTEPKKFREFVREIAALLAYEATADLAVMPRKLETPLAKMTGAELKEKVGLVPILRAGLGMVEGVWGLMPSAEVWHIGLYRDEHTLRPVEYYNKLPTEPTVSLCLILDPMLATGGSATATADVLKRWGVKKIKFVGLIGAPEGIKAMQEKHPDIDIHLAAIDSHLNERAYIVPGLGDAGDRQFGTG
jgi:uracil phosphoribosyltransferase